MRCLLRNSGWVVWDLGMLQMRKKIIAAKIIMFVIDDLVIAEQGKCCFWKGKQSQELNF